MIYIYKTINVDNLYKDKIYLEFCLYVFLSLSLYNMYIQSKGLTLKDSIQMSWHSRTVSC